VKKGMQKKVENGGWPKPATLGYKNVSDKVSSWIEVDPEKGLLSQRRSRRWQPVNGHWMNGLINAYSLGIKSKRGGFIPKHSGAISFITASIWVRHGSRKAIRP